MQTQGNIDKAIQRTRKEPVLTTHEVSKPCRIGDVKKIFVTPIVVLFTRPVRRSTRFWTSIFVKNNDASITTHLPRKFFGKVELALLDRERLSQIPAGCHLILGEDGFTSSLKPDVVLSRQDVFLFFFRPKDSFYIYDKGNTAKGKIIVTDQTRAAAVKEMEGYFASL